MHIADGIVPPVICAAAHVVSLTAVYGLGRRIEPQEVVRMGLLSAAVFVVSLIHFPVAGTSIHLGLFGLVGIVLGRRAFPVVFVTLLFQSLLFQHGGLLSLGLNALNMGTGALLGWIIWNLSAGGAALRAFTAGAAGVMLPAILIAVEFSISGYGKGFYFITMLYAGLAVVEGLLTTGIVAYFQRVKPEILSTA